MNFIRTIIFSFSTWVIASLMNGILSGIFLELVGEDSFSGHDFPLCIAMSFVFSVPFLFIFWIGFLICLSAGYEGRGLFMILLKLSLILSVLAGLFFVFVIGRFTGLHAWGIAVIIVFSAVSTMFIHRSVYLSMFKTNQFEKDL